MSPSIIPPKPKTGCSDCDLLGLGLCGLLIDQCLDRPYSAKPAIAQEQHSFGPRRTLFRQGDTIIGVPVVCDGWLASTYRLSNGRRQILAFVLPGEIITCRLIFEPNIHVSIDSITEGSYRTFDRSQFRSAIGDSPNILDRILEIYSAEKDSADDLITDLGRRTATERVARLLLGLWVRLEKLGLINDDNAEFPLRQVHIADATGLTPVYISKVLGDFRDDGLIEITDRFLKITDITGLRRHTLS